MTRRATLVFATLLLCATTPAWALKRFMLMGDSPTIP